jgi:hypothetical protein
VQRERKAVIASGMRVIYIHYAVLDRYNIPISPMKIKSEQVGRGRPDVSTRSYHSTSAFLTLIITLTLWPLARRSPSQTDPSSSYGSIECSYWYRIASLLSQKHSLTMDVEAYRWRYTDPLGSLSSQPSLPSFRFSLIVRSAPNDTPRIIDPDASRLST